MKVEIKKGFTSWDVYVNGVRVGVIYDVAEQNKSGIARLVLNFIDAEISKQGVYYRYTNNKSELELAHNKELRNSRNHNTGIEEAGLSVSTHPFYGSFNGYKYGYMVTGDVVGFGSDGEPLLDTKTLIVLSGITSDFGSLEKDYRGRENQIAKDRLMLTVDQYRALKNMRFDITIEGGE